MDVHLDNKHGLGWRHRLPEIDRHNLQLVRRNGHQSVMKTYCTIYEYDAPDHSRIVVRTNVITTLRKY